MESSALTYLTAILVMSFLGSWHCALMCGPIASQIGHAGSTSMYHLGRVASYTIGGALFGGLGTQLLNSKNKFVLLSAVLIFSGVVIISGLSKLQPGQNKFIFFKKIETKFKKFLFSKINFNPGRSSLLAGLLTGVLPCGWLFTFYSAAALSKSPFSGSLILFVFWLGSLPSLLAVSEFIKTSVLKSSKNQQRLSGVLLIASALFALVGHIANSGILSP